MTTVVFDGTILATDSQTTATAEGSCPHCEEKVHHLERDNPNKIRKPRNAKFKGYRIIAYASAGHVPTIRACDRALFSEVDLQVAMEIFTGDNQTSSNKKLSADCSILILTTGAWWQVEVHGGKVHIAQKYETDLPLFLGSGTPAARLAIKRLGLNAIGAMAVAIDADTYTGGRIAYIDISEETPEIEYYLWTKEDTDELFNDILKEQQ